MSYAATSRLSLLTILLALQTLTFSPRSSAEIRTVVCSEADFRSFSERVHVKCDQAYNGIQYFVVKKVDQPLLAELSAVRNSLADDSVLRLEYDTSDTSGQSVGCKPSDCRLITRARKSLKPYIHTFDIQGVDRRALIYPAVDGIDSPPAIFYFHGNSGNLEDSSNRRKFDELWPEAVIVYGEGMDVSSSGIPDDNGQLAWTLRFPYKFALGQTKDFDYTRYLLDRIIAGHGVDNERIYASGHSSGGFFTLSLMQLLPHRFSAFAVVAAHARYKVELRDPSVMIGNGARALQLSTGDRAAFPRPVLYVFGKKDKVFDNDGPNKTPGWLPNFQSETLSKFTLRQLMTRNNCLNVPVGTNYWIDTNRFNCTPGENGQVVSWQLHEGDHGWPNTANRWVVDFFKGF